MEAKEYILKHSTGEDLEGQTVDKFLSVLDQKLHEAKDQLIERFEWICKQSPEAANFETWYFSYWFIRHGRNAPNSDWVQST